MSDVTQTIPYGQWSTAAEVTEGLDASGLRAIVTGGSSGLGRETARALAAAGAEVTLAVRSRRSGEDAAAFIRETTGNDRVHVGEIDLASPASVAAFAGDWSGPLDVLVNNAGGIWPTLDRDAGGLERQFVTNHLGHFALSVRLRPALARAAEATGQARVVTLTSSGHLYSPVVFDDIHFRYRQYTDALGYGQAKTANVLFGVGAATRWADDGIRANAAMPGRTASTGYTLNMDPARRKRVIGDADVAGGEVPPGWKTVEQGAATSVLLAVSPLVREVTGRYFEDCGEAVVVEDNNGYQSGVAPYALDHDNADRLWTLSETLTGCRRRT